ncbi:GntR family transcriptional regulator [Nocardia harenae]|uniref:GntR family transcriptional regulator n=1 Tax=Nocardia harenae TaxID=358707 RepID=UPI0008379142|nr:GntR family transcriptional regulator [Nocardia harenae]
MMRFEPVDRSDPRPPYRQIADRLRMAIKAGEIAPGQRLPSEVELMSQFGVARMTMRQALQELKAEGLVYAQQGRGVFVRPTPPIRRLASDRFAREHRAGGKAAFSAEAEKAGFAPGVDRIRIARAAAGPLVAERLRIAPDAEVVVRTRRYLANGTPVEIAASYIPITLAAGTRIEDPDTGPGGIYARLEEMGHTLARFTEEVGARMPTPDERVELEIGEGEPVLTVVRTAFSTGDVAVEVCDTVKVAGAYLLEYDFPAR